MSRDGKHIFSHTMIYLLARGLPGIIAFLAIPLFTRLLSPDSYGRYALVMATVNLLNALLFQWLRLSLVRYLPTYANEPAKLKSTLASVTGLIILAVSLVASIFWLLPLPPDWHVVVLPCWLLMAIMATFELGCEYARASLRPWHFMVMQVVRSVFAVGLGAIVVKLGAGWWGPLAGLAVGMSLAIVYAGISDWRDVRPLLDRTALRKVALYGLPLSLTVALTIVISSSDRFLIAGFLGEDAAGLYSVAVDFTAQTLMLVMLVVNMAIFPIAVRAFENEGPEVARKHMSTNASMLLAIGLPCVVGIAILSPGVANCFLGKSFRETAAHIMPLIAIGTFLAAFKAFHFDAAFQFAHRTIVQVWIVLFAAVVNVVLNALIIPRYGINGSAAASVLAYCISIALTFVVGRKYFALPLPIKPLAQTACAAALMGAALTPFRHAISPVAFITQVACGACIYALALVAMNFMNVRNKIRGGKTPAFEVEPLTIESKMASAI